MPRYPTYTGPSADEIARGLAGIVSAREGLAPDTVVEHGGALLELAMVSDRVSLDSDADWEEANAAYAEVLTSVLRDAVATLGRHPKYRRALEVLLPLKEEFAGLPAERRRAAAGQVMMGHERPVKPATVRTYHQPKALALLASVLVDMEADARREQLPAALAVG